MTIPSVKTNSTERNVTYETEKEETFGREARMHNITVKFLAKGYLSLAGMADHLEFGPTFLTETDAVAIIRLALRALHEMGPYIDYAVGWVMRHIGILRSKSIVR